MTEKMEEAVELLKENILTPLLYVVEYDNMVQFICFCDKNIKLKVLYETADKITAVLGVTAEIFDIREFSEAERLEIMSHGQMVYSENPMIEEMFMLSMAEDYRKTVAEKNYMLERYRENGAYYLQ